MNERPTVSSDAPEIKLLVIGPQHDGVVSNSPELASWIDQGWHVRKARPRVTTGGLKFLVVLEKTPWLELVPPAGPDHAPAAPPPRREQTPSLSRARRRKAVPRRRDETQRLSGVPSRHLKNR